MALRKRNAPVKHEELLTLEEKDAIRVKAKAAVDEENRKRAAQEYLAQCMDEVRSETEPELATCEILIDVPGYTKYIMVDGRTFDQGRTYPVTKGQADSMREIVANAWRHERSNGGAHMKEYMAPKQDAVSAMSGSSMHKLARV